MYKHQLALDRSKRVVTRVAKIKNWSKKTLIATSSAVAVSVVASAGIMAYINSSVSAITAPFILGETPYQTYHA